MVEYSFYAIFSVVGDIYLNRLGFQTLQEIVESLTTPTTYNFIFIVIPVMSLFVALIDYRVASTAWIEYL